ncbi:MAG: Na+:solute symporter [bacterium]|nr:Na+:solute symporter [bacterium]
MILIDYLFIVIYFILVLGLGFWYRKRASADLKSYFLGGNKMHWLALAMSGSVSTFDITGTMWIVSMIFILGMKSMWIHWMWGWMMGAFCLAYMGKWVRRSNVMTGAEWMITRFGNDNGGIVARSAYAFVAVITLASFIGYAYQGIGKFASVYIPLPPTACALIIIGITTLYVLLGGLYSVVVTDVIQTVILTIASIFIAGVAFFHLSPASLHKLLPDGWGSLLPSWRLPELAGTANGQYEWFGALVLVWMLKGILLNAGGPAQMYDFQRFLAARDENDAAKIGAAWSLFLVVRWGMAMAIVLLALSGISDVHDPEKVMPLVLKEFLPPGVRGIVIAGLLAAFMSTFSSTVNSGASYIVRDFWQPFFRPRASQASLVRSGYLATIGIVFLGMLIGFQAGSIHQIWNWMMMALGAGVVIPNVLRWYWWRLNGWGYAAGSLAGVLFSLIALFMPELPLYVVFPIIISTSLAASLLVSWFGPKVDPEILISFYKTVRPFGLWKPVWIQIQAGGSSDGSEHGVRRSINKEVRPAFEKPGRMIMNVLLGMIAILGLYLSPMYFVGHWFLYAGICFGASVLAIAALYRSWYRPKE